MIITVTGTPGTGKTTVSEKLDCPVIHLTEFVKEKGLGEQKKDFEVDIPEMVEALDEETEKYDDFVIEGHLAHHYPSDVCIVLRCHPRVLDERLSQRDYTREKVEENLESEALDVILSQAVQKQENVIEIDTTDLEVEDVVERISREIEGSLEESYGNVDWSSWL